MKRLFDVLATLMGLLLLWPFFCLIALWVALDSKGGVFYVQQRIGLNGHSFGLFKFRTMVTDADKQGKLTVGARDSRITKAGYVLRKYKLDELPQLLNVLRGDMSIVGPRPEVKKYVDLYNEEQRKVLTVRPGLTDYASLAYINENEILGKASDPERTYIEEIMPEKLRLNLVYIQEKSLATDVKIILKTIRRILT